MRLDKDATFSYMDRLMDEKALELGKERLFQDVSRGRWNWDYKKERDKSLDEFVEMQLRRDNVPDFTSVEFIKRYFAKQFEAEYREYKGDTDEDNE